MKSPEGYPVSSYCTTCGRDFAGDTYFDKHRIGKHAYLYQEGLKFDPPVEDGRRCMDDEEMIEAGMRQMTVEEMQNGRHGKRVGFNVQMWFDPSEGERLRTAHTK